MELDKTKAAALPELKMRVPESDFDNDNRRRNTIKMQRGRGVEGSERDQVRNLEKTLGYSITRSHNSALLPPQSPSGSPTKSAPLHAADMDLRPEFRSVSCELREVARNIEGEDEKTLMGLSSSAANKSPLFERGRFYDAYSARRNERLKRKLAIEMEYESFKTPRSQCDLGVAAGTVKGGGSKRLESGSKSGAVDFQVDRSQHPRYSLRSTKENKKPPQNKKPPPSMRFDKSHEVKKTGTARRVVKKI